MQPGLGILIEWECRSCRRLKSVEIKRLHGVWKQVEPDTENVCNHLSSWIEKQNKTPQRVFMWSPS